MKRVFSSLVLLVMMVLNVATVSAQETKGFHQVLKNALSKVELDLWVLYCYV